MGHDVDARQILICRRDAAFLFYFARVNRSPVSRFKS